MTRRPLTGYRAGMMAERARRGVKVLAGRACFDPRTEIESIRFPRMPAEQLRDALARDTSTIVTLQRGATG